MTNGEFRAEAARFGFERVYFLRPERFDLGDNRWGLVADAAAEFPFASSIACLVYPYAPFTADERIPAYYLASNKAYRLMRDLRSRLAELGLRTEKAEIPAKLAFERAGVAAGLRNSLDSIPPYGSRVVLLFLAAEGIPPEEYGSAPHPPCAHCKKCAAACPNGAIGENGLDLSRCMRYYMDSACRSDSIRDRQKTFIGCEICQYACPLNAGLEAAEPDAGARAAFDIRALISGDQKRARSLVGKNITGNGKLIAEAIAFAARDRLIPKEELLPLLDEAEGSPFEAVRDAVRYARSKLAADQAED